MSLNKFIQGLDDLRQILSNSTNTYYYDSEFISSVDLSQTSIIEFAMVDREGLSHYEVCNCKTMPHKVALLMGVKHNYAKDAPKFDIALRNMNSKFNFSALSNNLLVYSIDGQDRDIFQYHFDIKFDCSKKGLPSFKFFDITKYINPAYSMGELVAKRDCNISLSKLYATKCHLQGKENTLSLHRSLPDAIALYSITEWLLSATKEELFLYYSLIYSKLALPKLLTLIHDYNDNIESILNEVPNNSIALTEQQEKLLNLTPINI